MTNPSIHGNRAVYSASSALDAIDAQLRKLVPTRAGGAA